MIAPRRIRATVVDAEAKPRARISRHRRRATGQPNRPAVQEAPHEGHHAS
jgi:hypothetical protein